MVTPATIHSWLGNRLTDAYLPELPGFYRGKVRDNYDLPDGRRVLISTDRQSAFDVVLAAVPLKGQVLNSISRFWFEHTEDICQNHVLTYPDPNVVIGKRLTMLPVEMVVREYLTGSTDTSVWTAYKKGVRVFCGNALPDGLKKNDRLPEGPILTPSTKPVDGTHDVSVSAEELLAEGLVTPEQWEELARISLALFARGKEIASQNGLILADTKYEFGLDENGKITLADEIHTPDSSRYFRAATYGERLARGEEPEHLNKEFLRLWITERCDPYTDAIPEIPDDVVSDFAGRYIALYEAVTGTEFVPPIDSGVPVLERIRANLMAALPEYFAS